MKDLDIAKNILVDDDMTLVIVKAGKIIYNSKDRGEGECDKGENNSKLFSIKGVVFFYQTHSFFQKPRFFYRSSSFSVGYLAFFY